jgi:3-oxoadipate enol-lactonase
VPESQFVAVGGVNLYYTVEGCGGLPLVFINSLGTDLRIWDKLTPYFVERFGIIRYDKRGHGLSDCPQGPYSIRDHTQDLAGLLGYLSVNQAILIGISVGGLIALDYTGKYPQRVRALVLCDTGVRIGTADLWNRRIEAIRKHGMEAVTEAVLGRWFVPEFSRQNPAAYQEYYDMLTQMPAVGYTATCEALRDAHLRDIVGTIGVKSLVLCGSEDTATPPELGRELAASLKDAQFELIENAAHLPCIEQPAAMAAMMLRYFQENGYVQ